jgi:hypothetical protein
MMQLGIKSISESPEKKHTLNDKLELQDSFILCQKCKHGGHFNHIFEWFRLNAECPFANCEC